MDNEIIYVCDSINNKNVRGGELNILEKHEEQLYFEFGSDRMNTKKRFYNDIDTLNKDFNELLKLKEKRETKIVKEDKEEVIGAVEVVETELVTSEKSESKKTKQSKVQEEDLKSDKYKIIKRKK
jgi:hypothetical protein